MENRLTDILNKERKIAYENLIFAYEKPLSYECLKDLSTYHGKICMQYQKALKYRNSYAKLKQKKFRL